VTKQFINSIFDTHKNIPQPARFHHTEKGPSDEEAKSLVPRRKFTFKPFALEIAAWQRFFATLMSEKMCAEQVDK